MRLEEQTNVRARNGDYLDGTLGTSRIVKPVKPVNSDVFRSFALYAFRVEQAEPEIVPKDLIVRALVAEGVPAVPGYRRPVYEEPIFTAPRDEASREYAQLKHLDTTAACPVSERLCRSEAIWLSQQTLLCDQVVVRQIADGIHKVAESLHQLADGLASGAVS
jgi:hypothetical protein